MIRLRKGDILKADAEALVNTVNCVGVMGRGIALQFKKAYPDNFKKYKAACDKKEVRPGHMFIFETRIFQTLRKRPLVITSGEFEEMLDRLPAEIGIEDIMVKKRIGAVRYNPAAGDDAAIVQAWHHRRERERWR